MTDIAESKVRAEPLSINPVETESLRFAEWRQGHIQRYLDQNPGLDPDKKAYLESERDMYRAQLAMARTKRV
jgi:hypothetical protein